MSRLLSSRHRRGLLLSASSLVWLTVSGSATLAQNDTAAPPPVTPQAPAAASSTPPAATSSQLPAASPPPAAPAAPAAQPENAAPAQQPAPEPAPPQQSDSGGGNVLPETVVSAPVEHRHPRTRPPTRVVSNQPPQPSAVQVVAKQNQAFDAARQSLLAPTGTSPYQISQQNIAALPQGANTSLDRVLLQAPGVSQDSASSGDLHVRNEHGNVQYRINGIMLPDGVGNFGQIIDSGIIGSMALITGALPAQYGLHTAGVIDIQTKQNAFDNSGSVSLYGGSHGTITPSLQYGGTVGNTQYYVSGRYFGSDLGLENPTPAYSAIHDHTDQEKGFLYLSTVLDPTMRLTFMSGVANSQYQIPNNPGQAPQFSPFGVSDFNSANLNENQSEFNQFNVLALQYSHEGLDVQTAYFNRTTTLHFMPDVIGDLVFNGVASDVYRQSEVNGIQTDASYRLADAHTLHAGFTISTENSLVRNQSEAVLLDPATGLPIDGTSNPFNVSPALVDESAKTGFLFGTYIADEWKITNQVTLNYGLRFDQMTQYVNANQVSPRISVTYTPWDGTVFHAGYARYFTPPEQTLAAPTNLALVQGTAQQPSVNENSPVLPERSHYFDAGVTQRILPGLDVGVDAYYKIAQDLLDDGQFGAAYVLSAFNYAYGENAGVEFKAKYTNGNFTAYGNLAVAKQTASQVVSNQYLFAADELAYLAAHDVYTDHSQFVSGSAGVSYLWNGTRFSADMIYGSGLREGFANTGTVPGYTQVNLGISHEFKWFDDKKPTTLRFDIVNLFDSIYEIRDGSGIGVFAPQYGPRRGFFIGISQKL